MVDPSAQLGEPTRELPSRPKDVRCPALDPIRGGGIEPVSPQPQYLTRDFFQPLLGVEPAGTQLPPGYGISLERPDVLLDPAPCLDLPQGLLKAGHRPRKREDAQVGPAVRSIARQGASRVHQRRALIR